MTGFIGILSLDTRFPRIQGDSGNPESYHLPARVRVIDGASGAAIVRDGPPDEAFVARFIEAARAFESEGAVLITSSCGFLVSVQHRIARAVNVPVMLSGLCLVPLALHMTAGRPVGVLTASAQSLGPSILAAAGIDPDQIRIAGLEHRAAFADTFLPSRALQKVRFDVAQMERLVVEEGRALIARAPEIGVVILECGNLPPYAEALRHALGRPVLSILDGARLLSG